MREDREYLKSYEEIENHYNDNFPFSMLHYAIMYRRFEKVEEILLKNLNHLDEILFCKGKGKNLDWITPIVCLCWNKAYLTSYCDKHKSPILDIVNPYIKDEEYPNLLTYDDKIKDEHTVFSLFFDGEVPILDVEYFEKQTIASKQIQNNHRSLVLDEVGTGKTVTALYAIQTIINECLNESRKAKILIIAPYNKREDWQDDIRRQLGRYSHIVNQGDKGYI